MFSKQWINCRKWRRVPSSYKFKNTPRKLLYSCCITSRIVDEVSWWLFLCRYQDHIYLNLGLLLMASGRQWIRVQSRNPSQHAHLYTIVLNCSHNFLSFRHFPSVLCHSFIMCLKLLLNIWGMCKNLFFWKAGVERKIYFRPMIVIKESCGNIQWIQKTNTDTL